MINELLSKYKEQKPKTFGENHMERCYPVSAVISMLEEQSKQLRQPLVSGSVADAVGRNCQFCGEPCVECSHKATDH